MLSRRDIRKAGWWEEVAEYFDIDRELLQKAVADKRLNPEEEPKDLKEAREVIRQQLMTKESIELHDKVLYEEIHKIKDLERSS